MPKDLALVTIRINRHQLKKGNSSFRFFLTNAAANQVAALALRSSLAATQFLPNAIVPDDIKRLAANGQAIEEKYAHALDLLRAAYGHIAATELDPPGDTLAFKIQEFLDTESTTAKLA